MMANVIVGGKRLPVKVVFVGGELQVWIVADVYNLFVGDKNITVTDPEARELAIDIEQLNPQELEQKWLAIAKEFLNSL
jgi:hypothetical protein